MKRVEMYVTIAGIIIQLLATCYIGIQIYAIEHNVLEEKLIKFLSYLVISIAVITVLFLLVWIMLFQ